MQLEVCVDSAESLAAALAGGADRIELCSALELGGLTPSPGLMALAAKAPVPVFAMIRPLAGGFEYSPADLQVMIDDIGSARQAGLEGVVFGVSLADGQLDLQSLAMLMGVSVGLATSLHRVFDLVPDLSRALEQAAGLGFGRILTSGGAKTAPAGAATLADLYRQANGRIGILPGAGITVDNVGKILTAAPFGEVHASCSIASPVHPRAVQAGFSQPTRRTCEAGMVRALKSAMTRT